MLRRHAPAERLHKSSFLWQEEQDYIASCQKRLEENGGNDSLLYHLLRSQSSSLSVLPFNFEPAVLQKHVRESHAPSEPNELSEHEGIEVLQISPHHFQIKSNKPLSANSTASGLYGGEQVQTEICDFGGLFHFDTKADVDEVIAAATLDILHHSDGEMMSKLAYHAGPGGGRGVVLKLEPFHKQAADMTWGMWRSALGDITKYYDKEGLTPIDFYVTLLTEQTKLLIGGGSLVHDLWQEKHKDLVMEEVE